jgi:hypothetical protein
MDRAPWQNPRILYTLLFVFLSGAVAGALTMRFTVPPERHRGGPSWKEGTREISLQKFRKELDLSPDQEKEMETVLDDFVTYYQTLQAQMDDVRATGKQRILRILKDDQKQKFEKMIGELQNKALR